MRRVPQLLAHRISATFSATFFECKTAMNYLNDASTTPLETSMGESTPSDPRALSDRSHLSIDTVSVLARDRSRLHCWTKSHKPAIVR